MSSHRQRGMPRGSLSTNRYVVLPDRRRSAFLTRREYRDVLHHTRGFAKPRLK